MRAKLLKHHARASFNNSQFLDVVDICLKTLHPRRLWSSSSKYVVTSHTNCILLIFFIFNTDFTIFTVPKRASHTLKFQHRVFNVLNTDFFYIFRKLDATSPVAPKIIGNISNVKLGYDSFSSDGKM